MNNEYPDSCKVLPRCPWDFLVRSTGSSLVTQRAQLTNVEASTVHVHVHVTSNRRFVANRKSRLISQGMALSARGESFSV
jgi:hypothetical protein